MTAVADEFAIRVTSRAEARAWVRARTTGARENFSVLSVFVPTELRDDFAAVYAFCRVSDDIADETGADASARERSVAMLGQWRAMVIEAHARAMNGGGGRGGGSGGFEDAAPCAPTHPVMLALEGAIARHALALHHFTDLLDAFEEDQRVTRWPSLAELKRYSTRSANPVGRLVLGLYGVRERDASGSAPTELLAASDAMCTALQLTNFWQDVRRDLLERDRVYVPCEEIGIDPRQLEAWIRGPRDSEAQARYAAAMQPLHRATRAMFEVGRGVIELGPHQAHRVLSLFWQGGTRTLDRVVAAQGHELWERPRLGRAAKAWLVARELLRPRSSHGPGRTDVARA